LSVNYLRRPKRRFYLPEDIKDSEEDIRQYKPALVGTTPYPLILPAYQEKIALPRKISL
jgi:hypothetical protein